MPETIFEGVTCSFDDGRKILVRKVRPGHSIELETGNRAPILPTDPVRLVPLFLGLRKGNCALVISKPGQDPVDDFDVESLSDLDPMMVVHRIAVGLIEATNYTNDFLTKECAGGGQKRSRAPGLPMLD